MKKMILNILIIIYIIMAIFLTILLLSYNDFKVTILGDNTFILIKNNEYSPQFNKGDLVIVNTSETISTGSKVFYFDSNDSKVKIALGTVDDSEQITSQEKAYVIDGEKKVTGKYVIGLSETAKVIPNAGTVLGVLESKWGFLFIIVLPALLLVVNQAGVVFTEIKEAKKDGKVETSKA